MVPEPTELLLREREQALRRDGIAAFEVNARRRELDQRLQKDLVVASALFPKQLPFFVGLEEASGAKFPEAMPEVSRRGTSEARERGGRRPGVGREETAV